MANSLVEQLGWLRDLPLLVELDIWGCEMVKDLTSLGELQRLRVLHFDGTRVENYRWMKGLIALERVNFEDDRGEVHVHPPGNVEPYTPMLEL